MLVIHTGDFHLGESKHGPIDPATGMSKRIDDFFSAFDQIVDYAEKNKADLFLLCGDTFKDPVPNPTIMKRFASRLARLSNAAIRTVIIGGNHDAPRAGRAAPPEPFIELKTPNVYFYSNPDFLDLDTRSGEKVRLFIIPFRNPVRLASDIRKGKTGLDREVLVKAFREEIEREIEIFTQAGKKKSDVAILMSHLAVEGAQAGSEKIWQTGEEFSVLPSTFDTEIFDYVALAHIHKHQVINSKIPIVYPGSIERVDLGEAKEDKGFISIKAKKASVEWKFIKLSTRPMHNLQVDCRGVKDPVASVKEHLENKPVEGSIIRLRIILKDRLSDEKRSQIANLVGNAFWSQLDYQRSQVEKQVTKGAFGETLGPFEALTKYVKTLKISKDDKDLALKLGHQVINETTMEVET